MPDYTVIGIYDDGATFAETMSGFDAHDAISRVASMVQYSETLQIIGAVRGLHDLVPSCGGCAVYASDLRKEETP